MTVYMNYMLIQCIKVLGLTHSKMVFFSLCPKNDYIANLSIDTIV